MPRTKGGGGGGSSSSGGWGVSGGDWSETGTFVRKPPTGWLHSEQDLTDGAYVRYQIAYLGCVQITESMRTLQYQARTLVTREAITKLAEHSDRIATNKKRKVPRQISRLLGDFDTQFASDINLCIDVDQIQIISAVSGREFMTHSLTSISFASGGEGITQDFFGYVAKDPLHERACHVFHCQEGIAQLILATVGQAFELRYKMYLNSSHTGFPASNPPATTPPSLDHDRRLSSSPSASAHQRSLPPIPSVSPPHSNGYVDSPSYNEYSEPLPHPVSLISDHHYENQPGSRRHLPSKPPPITEISSQNSPFPSHVPPPRSKSSPPTPPLKPPRPPLSSQFPPPSLTTQPPNAVSRTGIYSELPGFPDPISEYELEPEEQVPQQRPLSYNPYDTMPMDDFVTTRDNIQESPYDIPEGIEDIRGHIQALPPPLPPPLNDVPSPIPPIPPVNDDYDTINEDLPPSRQPPKEDEYQLITIHQQPSVDKEDTEDHIDITPVPPIEEEHIYSNEVPVSSPDYDDPVNLTPPTTINNPTKPGEYDEVDIVFKQSLSLEETDGPPPPYSGLSPLPRRKEFSSPFDDSIYATPKQPEVLAPPFPEVDPFAPLDMQLYFHGRISRPDAESLIKSDGEFLVRESTNKPGQYVLTGKANGRPQHLLLIDKSGKVKSKDKEFESVPHLVKFFFDRATPLTIGNCAVYLSEPVECR